MDSKSILYYFITLLVLTSICFVINKLKKPINLCISNIRDNCILLKDNRSSVIVELNEVQVVNGELLPIVVGIPVTPILTVPT